MVLRALAIGCARVMGTRRGLVKIGCLGVMALFGCWLHGWVVLAVHTAVGWLVVVRWVNNCLFYCYMTDRTLHPGSCFLHIQGRRAHAGALGQGVVCRL